MVENRTVRDMQMPTARYAYYRRCQVMRKGGEQCKAPAEKGAQICHAHAAQQALAMRRERERQAVLAEAVAEMRRRGRLEFGKDEFEAKDLFMDFKGIQITIAKMAQALIDGRIDCKTAGRLAVHLQTMSKLLWLYHRGHRGTRRKALTAKDTKEHKGVLICKSQRFIFNSKALAFPASSHDYVGSRQYWPEQQTRAA